MAVDKSVNANPTKSFFIGILTKDIELSRAILDLVDNSIDGALRTRTNSRFEGLWICIDVSPDAFRITDNCGGIPLEVAQKYAFRFGRPDAMPQTLHSVGQFGVGMKRALFKLGSKFVIESKTKSSRFVLEVDVNEWKKTESWTFDFKELETDLKDVPVDEQGTKINVAPLHESVAQDFKMPFFIKRLSIEISRAHQKSIEQGLAISVNKIPLTAIPMNFFFSETLKPVKIEERFTLNGGVVDVKIFAGVSDPNPGSAGWYVYCNGRMILEADQTNITGWGEDSEATIPKYHNDYAMFRGFVFFDSDNAGLLPWNTTKTGVDADSLIFRSVRLQMITLMAQVFTFLRAFAKEKAGDVTDYSPLRDTITNARVASVANVETSSVFLWRKTSPKPKVPKGGRIQYNESMDKINKVKNVLNVSSLKEVGEKTFDYFYDREVEK